MDFYRIQEQNYDSINTLIGKVHGRIRYNTTYGSPFAQIFWEDNDLRRILQMHAIGNTFYMISHATRIENGRKFGMKGHSYSIGLDAALNPKSFSSVLQEAYEDASGIKQEDVMEDLQMACQLHLHYNAKNRNQ